jgi:predicted hydrocarbon binding protein
MEDAAKRFAPMMNLGFMGMGALSKAFYKKYGKEALPIIAEVWRQVGVEQGKIMQQMVPAKSITAIAEMYKQMATMMGMEVVESSDKVFHFKMSQFPVGIEGTSRELCEAMMDMDKGVTSTVLGQEAKMKVLETVAAGDKLCEVIEPVN